MLVHVVVRVGRSAWVWGGVYLVIGEALRHDGRLYEVYSGKVSGGRVVMVFQVVECDCEVSLYRNGD